MQILAISKGASTNVRSLNLMLLLLLFLQQIDKGLSQMFELTEQTFDQYTRDKDIMLVEFFMPWCRHCQALQPEWEKASKILADNKEYVLGKVNCWESGKPLCDKLKIPIYPTISLYRHGNFVESYQGDRTAAAILDFVARAQSTTGTVGSATSPEPAPLPPVAPSPPAPPPVAPFPPVIAPPPSAPLPPQQPPQAASPEVASAPAVEPSSTGTPSAQQPMINLPPTAPPAPQQPVAQSPPQGQNLGQQATNTPAPSVESKLNTQSEFIPYESPIPPPPMLSVPPPPMLLPAQSVQSFGPVGNQVEYNTPGNSIVYPEPPQPATYQQEKTPLSAAGSTIPNGQPLFNTGQGASNINGNTFWNAFKSDSATNKFQSTPSEWQQLLSTPVQPVQLLSQPQSSTVAQTARLVPAQLPSAVETALQRPFLPVQSLQYSERFTNNKVSGDSLVNQQSLASALKETRPVNGLSQPSLWNLVQSKQAIQGQIPTNRYSQQQNLFAPNNKIQQPPPSQTFAPYNKIQQPPPSQTQIPQSLYPSPKINYRSPAETKFIPAFHAVQPFYNANPADTSFQQIKSAASTPFASVESMLARKYPSFQDTVDFYQARENFNHPELDKQFWTKPDPISNLRLDKHENKPSYLTPSLYNRLLQRRKEFSSKITQSPFDQRPYVRGKLLTAQVRGPAKSQTPFQNLKYPRISKSPLLKLSPLSVAGGYTRALAHYSGPISVQLIQKMRKQKMVEYREKARLRALRNQKLAELRSVRAKNVVYQRAQRQRQIALFRAAQIQKYKSQQRHREIDKRRKFNNKNQINQNLRTHELFYNIPTFKHNTNSLPLIARLQQPQTDEALIRRKPLRTNNFSKQLTNYKAPQRMYNRNQAMGTNLVNRNPQQTLSRSNYEAKVSSKENWPSHSKPLYGRMTLAQIKELKSKQNAARVHEAHLTHFFASNKPDRTRLVLQQKGPSIASKKSAKYLHVVKERQPVDLINFWDQVYKYYSRAAKSNNKVATTKSVTPTRPVKNNGNMKELALVENFLDSKLGSSSKQTSQANERSRLNKPTAIAGLDDAKMNPHDIEQRESTSRISHPMDLLSENSPSKIVSSSIVKNDLAAAPVSYSPAQSIYNDHVTLNTQRQNTAAHYLPERKSIEQHINRLIDSNTEAQKSAVQPTRNELSGARLEHLSKLLSAYASDNLESSQNHAKEEGEEMLAADIRRVEQSPTEAVKSFEHVSQQASDGKKLTTESMKVASSDAVLREARVEAKENAKTKQSPSTTPTESLARRETSPRHPAKEFDLKAISHKSEPWDKRAKVTFKLSKKSFIPGEIRDVVGVFGSLKKKRKKKRKRKRKRSHTE